MTILLLRSKDFSCLVSKIKKKLFFNNTLMYLTRKQILDFKALYKLRSNEISLCNSIGRLLIIDDHYVNNDLIFMFEK